MKDQLPNLRLLGVESSDWGRDWDSLVPQIDQKIEDYAFELASQEIYIEFSQWPNLPKVMIYRSVIGPIKEIEPPYTLTDWESAPVERFELQSELWVDLFEEIATMKKDIVHAHDFILVLSRQLEGELFFNKQVLFR